MQATYSHHPGALLDDGQRHAWKFADTGTVSAVRVIKLSQWQRKLPVDVDSLPGRKEMLDAEARIAGSPEFRRRAARIRAEKSSKNKETDMGEAVVSPHLVRTSRSVRMWCVCVLACGSCSRLGSFAVGW